METGDKCLKREVCLIFSLQPRCREDKPTEAFWEDEGGGDVY